MEKKALNPKQRRFVAEYLKDQNGTQSAIRAGYSKKTAYAIASENLKKPEIREALAELDKRVLELGGNAIADKAERQRFWTDAMRKPDLEFQHRIKTSELLGKTQGDFIEKVEHSVEVKLLDLILAAIKSRNNVSV